MTGPIDNPWPHTWSLPSQQDEDEVAFRQAAYGDPYEDEL